MTRNWAMAFVGFLFLASSASAGTMVEDAFDDGVIDPSKWQLSGSGSVVETDGVLKFTVDAVGPGAEPYAYLRRELVGDFDVWSSYLWVSSDHRDYSRSGLHIEDPITGDQIARLYCYDDDTRPLIYFLVTDQSSKTVTNSPLEGALRLARTGGTLSAYYGEVSDWHLIWSWPITEANVEVALFANNLDSSPAYPSLYPGVEAHWDDFHAEATAIVPEPSTLGILGMGAVSLLTLALRRRGRRRCSTRR